MVVCAVLWIEPWQDPCPPQFTSHVCPAHVTACAQEPFAEQEMAHVPVALHVIALGQLPTTTQATLHSLPPHVMSPQLLLPVHEMSQLLASAQSTPAAQAPCPTQSTKHGIPLGHFTALAVQGLLSPQLMKHVPSL